MYRSPDQLDREQFEATRGIETVPAYQEQDGSTQLIVPTLDADGAVVSTKTVHAHWRSELSITRSIWYDSKGNYYRVIPKCKFYPEFADCSCS